jgi:hypothetical protein
MNNEIVKCGDANPKGNISLIYKGGCGEILPMHAAYRCTGCGGWFHINCIFKHFKLEKECDWGRKEEKDQFIAELDDLLKNGQGRVNWRRQIVQLKNKIKNG